MARQSAAKPCVKQKLAGQESVPQIPWQELGMWSLSPFSHLLQLSPAWGAGATWLMAREGGAAIALLFPCPRLREMGSRDTGSLQHLHKAQTVETVGRSCLLPARCCLGGINRGRLFPSCQSHASQKLHVFSSK